MSVMQPEMMPPEMMGGGMPPGMPPEMGMMGEFPPGMGGPPPQESGADPELLQQILDLFDSYRQNQQSQQNLLMAEKARTLVQQILASEEKEMDGMLQGKLSPGAIRRMAGAS